MDIVTVAVWIIGGATSVIYPLIAVIWVMLRQESKQHAVLIAQKADSDRLQEAEQRWQNDLDKSEQRRDKEVLALRNEMLASSARLSEQIRSSENNILAQLGLVLRMIDKSN